MRRWAMWMTVLLVVAACGDARPLGSESTATTGGATTVDATKGEARDEKKDPTEVQVQGLSKGLQGLRTGGGTTATTVIPAVPGDRGDDPYLDGLWEACAAGDMVACDTLYRDAPAGSDYERFGDTCGGTTGGGVWCSDPATPEAGGYGSDAVLDALWDDCAAGDPVACDTLYVESPVGSEYESFGATCGDRTDGSAWCVDEFPATGDDLGALWAACAAGDWEACDTLYIEAPEGSEDEWFGATCGGLSDGSRWCVDEFGGAGGYGDEAYLDDLWDACSFGDWEACDQLYLESPAGSEYEAFGATCGNRTDGSLWCVDEALGDPATYGDDPDLDALWDACAAGDWGACDELYGVAPIGSEYETYGATCGYLTDGADWCVDVIWEGGEATDFGDDPYLDGLWTACEGGDWAACDQLYWDSPIDSEYEAFGGTCGYRTDGSELCVTAMTP